mmetsp:Transcript_53731/g.61699  ORF Transcript_53731/g.61699 Transcript_53731/m.61699 type:complete len:199 (+) Transcript_53731:40-636(+)
MNTKVVVLAALVAVALAVTCPPCDQTACNTALCGSAAPYYCESGRSAGGCGTTPEAWNNTKMCTACCDTSNCSSSRFSCGSCSTEFCEDARRCAIKTPYMCTSGTSEWGCTSTPGFWPLQHTCSGCCDVTSCEKKCAPCTAAQCSVNVCPSADPFFCTAGPLKNGCSNSSAYFGDASQCYDCCDASACATPAPINSTK